MEAMKPTSWEIRRKLPMLSPNGLAAVKGGKKAVTSWNEGKVQSLKVSVGECSLPSIVGFYVTRGKDGGKGLWKR